MVPQSTLVTLLLSFLILIEDSDAALFVTATLKNCQAFPFDAPYSFLTTTELLCIIVVLSMFYMYPESYPLRIFILKVLYDCL